jgi:hypothetical protein
MPTFRQRLSEILLGTELKQYRQAANLMREAYLQGPYVHSPEQLVNELKEFDSAILQDVMTSLQWDLLGTVNEGYGNVELERTRAVDESRRLWRRDVLTAWIVQTWTNFGFGENIVITPEDPKAQDDVDPKTGELIEEGIWTEYWEADRNQPVLADDILHHLSDQVLVDGELFLVYYISTVDGSVTVRVFETKQITEIVTEDNDSAVPLFYKRLWQDKKTSSKELYYPDAMAYISDNLKGNNSSVLPDGAKRADTEKSSTLVLVQHVAHNKKYDLRGWPLMTAGAAWTRAHKRFREDRASVASLVAMTVNKLKVKGGSRAVDAMKAKMEQIPNMSGVSDGTKDWIPNAPGTFVQNSAADLERMPLSTSAGDAKQDGEALLLMAGLGGGLFPHWLGAGDAYRLATATAMETPLLREFDRYQRFWGAQFRRMVRIVLWADQTYGLNLVEAEVGKKYKTFTAQVSTDRLVETDIPQLATSIGIMVQQALIPTAAVMPAEVTKHVLQAIWRQLLQAMGVEDAVNITSDEVFKIGEEAPAQPLGYQAGQAAGSAQAGGPTAPIPGVEPATKGPKAPPVKGGPPTAPPQPSGGMRVVESHAGMLALVVDEAVTPDGKFVPKEKMGKVTVTPVITEEDIDSALKSWDKDMGGDVKGMLK